MRIISPTSALERQPSGQTRGRGSIVDPRPAAQSRLLSGIEAATNVLLGMGLSLALQILLFPLIGVEASPFQHLSLLGVFTVVSYLRVYVLRRLFERRRRCAR